MIPRRLESEAHFLQATEAAEVAVGRVALHVGLEEIHARLSLEACFDEGPAVSPQIAPRTPPCKAGFTPPCIARLTLVQRLLVGRSYSLRDARGLRYR